jgi:hypothetical protein
VDPERKQEFLELATEAVGQGMSPREFAKLLEGRGTFDAKTIREADQAPYVAFPNGFRLTALRYVQTVARTTIHWASNRGVLDRCKQFRTEFVEVMENPGTIDFCLELEGKVFALTETAAEAAGCQLLSSTPNGGPPFHPNCRHTLAPYQWLDEDLPEVDDAVLVERGTAANQRFAEILERDPARYARQIGESAALRGFGGLEGPVPPGLVDQPIPFLPVGQKETFGTRGYSEDYHLVKRLRERAVKSRVDYRQKVTDALREAVEKKSWVFHKRDRLLVYYGQGWVVRAKPDTGQVVTAHRLDPRRWEKEKRKWT